MATTRREFLERSAAAAAGLALPRFPGVGRHGRRDKLRIGVIGVADRGADNLNGVAHEHIAALCDVDERFLAKAAQRFPDARTYFDFRELLQGQDLDAVVISTPDHTHAPATVLALENGLDVYCEKPLTLTVGEARKVTELAAAKGAVTQMGTQIHALDNYRRVVELVRAGTVGPIAEVHVYCSTRAWAGGQRGPIKTAPDYLHFDLWLGPAPNRPFHDGLHPADWRRFWDFGGGNMADMGCHYTDLAFWALDLKHPLTVQAHGPAIHPETTPFDLRVDYTFPARGELPPVALSWYDGHRKPDLYSELALGKRGFDSAVVFVGAEGILVSDYDKYLLLPEEGFTGFTPPEQTIPASIGHYKEWLQACRDRTLPTCHFGYAGPLTEAILLGSASYRMGGLRLDWRPDSLEVAGQPVAQAYIHRHYRKGWGL